VARSRRPGTAWTAAGVRDAASARAQLCGPYVDYSGRDTGYAVVDVAKKWAITTGGWPETNIWKVERMLLDFPAPADQTSDQRFRQLRKWVIASTEQRTAAASRCYEAGTVDAVAGRSFCRAAS
jgi:hypothetical protein